MQYKKGSVLWGKPESLNLNQSQGWILKLPLKIEEKKKKNKERKKEEKKERKKEKTDFIQSSSRPRKVFFSYTKSRKLCLQ